MAGAGISSKGNDYLIEIDSLRAIAVLSVTLYHFGVPFLPGGFIGVDVFFVISGFLISRLIFTAIEAKNFSFADFYIRRAKRILPAMVVVSVATLIAAKIVYNGPEFYDLRESAFFALTFLANLHFNAGSDYFASGSETQPFLHFWSLAVEEQFYILWPALLVAFSGLLRNRSRFVLAAVILIGVCSFAYGQILLQTDARAAFFLIWGRIWEFVLGAALVFVPSISSQALTAAMRTVGVTLILGSAALLNSSLPFPGLLATLPCLGAALVIWPARGISNFASRALSWPLLRFVGLISYSAYLWHWPVFVLANHVFAGNNGFGFVGIVGLLLITFALSVVTWWAVEKPARAFNFSGRTRAAALLGSFLLLACGAFVWIITTPSREWTSEKYIVREQIRRAAEGPAVDVGFFGDSSCLTGIHSPTVEILIGAKTASYCMFGTVGAFGDAAAINLLKARNALPGRLVIVIHPLQLGRQGLPQRWKDVVSLCATDSLCGSLIPPENVAFGRLKGAFTAKYSTAKELVTELASSGSLVDPSRKAFSKEPIPQEMPDKFLALEKPLVKALEGIDRSRIYLIVPPVPVGQSAGGFQNVKKMLAEMLGISEKHVLDTQSEYPELYFATRSHLTEEGRAIFSKDVASSLLSATTVEDGRVD